MLFIVRLGSLEVSIREIRHSLPMMSKVVLDEFKESLFRFYHLATV